MYKFLLLAALVVPAAYYFGNSYLAEQNVKVPVMPETNWGPTGRAEDKSIKPFKIDVAKDVIDDLNERLSRTRELVPPLENAAWTYGISSQYLQKIIHYWKNRYQWNERQDLLNKYPQFTTNIQGLNIHFYHVKPDTSKLKNTEAKKLKVLPLLLVHGWPGSIVEFQKIFPILTTPQKGNNFVFEVIAPSLPGYGFSEGAVRPGMGPAQMAVVFKNLMERLGFEKYYTQGGDWGSVITSSLAILYPEKVYGSHFNMCPLKLTKPNYMLMLGSFYPSLVVEPEHQSKVYPLKDKFKWIMEESGYMHLQATKPDTIGTALSDSPAALAAYILEKFSTWTNPEYKLRHDGGLLEKFHMDELLDNVMVYWVTRSITTSVRLYAESFQGNNFGLLDPFPLQVPSACANFPHELAYTPESIAKSHIKNLVQFTHPPRGGHFAAFEEPELFADDFSSFVDKVEKMNAEKIIKEKQSNTKNPKQ